MRRRWRRAGACPGTAPSPSRKATRRSTRRGRQWLQKSHFMCLMKNARIAALRSNFDPVRGRLAIRAPDGDTVEANALTEAGRARIGAWLAAFLGPEARGVPRFHHVEGHSFCDQRRKVVSLINLASLAEFAARVGAPREKRRFRANLYFSSGAPWAELDWIGRDDCRRRRAAARGPADLPLPGDRGEPGDGHPRRGPGRGAAITLRAHQSRCSCGGGGWRRHRGGGWGRGVAGVGVWALPARFYSPLLLGGACRRLTRRPKARHSPRQPAGR